MSKHEKKKGELSRREFIRLGIAAPAAAAVAGPLAGGLVALAGEKGEKGKKGKKTDVWIFHGKNKTRLLDFPEFKRRLRHHRSDIVRLAGQRIENSDNETIAEIAHLLSTLRLGEGETRVVSASKAIHHFLPELVPPIDRRYTIRFFWGYDKLVVRKNPSGSAQRILKVGIGWRIRERQCTVMERGVRKANPSGRWRVDVVRGRCAAMSGDRL